MSEPQKKPNITTKEYARFLRQYLTPRWHLVLTLAITLFIHIGLQLINPQILRSFIDTASVGGAMEMLTRLALIFIAVAVTNQLIGVLVMWVTERLGWSTTNALRADLARYTLGLDMSFHTAHTPGEMIERIDGDVMALSNFFSQFILQVFGNILLVIGILAVLLREDWRVSLGLGVFVVLTIVILLRLANVAVNSWEEERQASANLFSFLEERMAGTEDIRSNNAMAYVLNKFYALTRDQMQKTIRAGLKLNILLNTTWVSFAVGNAVAIVISAWLFNQGRITLGTVFMIIYYSNMLTWPLERITQQMQDLQRAGASLVRIMGLQRIQGKIPGEDLFEAPAQPRFQSGALGIEFWKVTFGYADSASAKDSGGNGNGKPSNPDLAPSTVIGDQYVPGSSGKTGPLNGGIVANEPGTAVVRPHAGDIVTGDTAAAAFASALSQPAIEDAAIVEDEEKDIVLRNISFRLEPGRIIGLLGRTGSGKTTLTRLIFRLYDPDSGSIRLGERAYDDESGMVDIRKLPVQDLRRRVGMVTQNIQLFNATVRDNLTFFNTGITDAQILEAIEDLGLMDWFKTLPKGLDTELESGGGGLSAGEAQLLAFTRIFLRDPGLVILDEATSRLDPATEALIERAVDKLTHNRTAIIVAHRLGTVQRADDILILEDGRVIEYGDRVRLAEDPDARFHQLLKTGLEEVLA